MVNPINLRPLHKALVAQPFHHRHCRRPRPLRKMIGDIANADRCVLVDEIEDLPLLLSETRMFFHGFLLTTTVVSHRLQLSSTPFSNCLKPGPGRLFMAEPEAMTSPTYFRVRLHHVPAHLE